VRIEQRSEVRGQKSEKPATRNPEDKRMKRIIRLMTLLFFMVCGLAFTSVAGEDNALSINEGADSLAFSITE